MDHQFDLFQNPDSAILEADNYPVFRERLQGSGCRLCDLASGRQRIVVDRGNPEAGIMAVGEGPGEQEDLQGRAFVGRAGKLLDRLFAESGILTERELLIANIVKCRPPANRAPQKNEAEACLPYLRKQIALVRPHTLLLLGAVSVRHLFREKGAFTMKDEVGRIFIAPDYPGTEFMILYHPAYLLRDPRKQPEFRQHIEFLKKHLKETGRRPGVSP